LGLTGAGTRSGEANAIDAGQKPGWPRWGDGRAAAFMVLQPLCGLSLMVNSPASKDFSFGCGLRIQARAGRVRPSRRGWERGRRSFS